MKRAPLPMRPILIVDDEDGVLTSLKVTLRQAGLSRVIACRDSRHVPDLLADNEIELVLLDLYMPHLSGETLLESIAREHPGVPVIVITGASDVETAVRCMKIGAFDYLTKPVEAEPLIAAVNRAVEMRALQNENEVLRTQLLGKTLSPPEAFGHIITVHRQMRSIFQYLNAIAATHHPLLITGETGTGKELAAMAVHRASEREGQFVVVNVGGLSDQMFDDTLFGHVKGAFTGADQFRPGMIAKAARGTLVLDEIGDLNANAQAKLLRLLQNREYQHLGDDALKQTDARIIALTNQDLWSLQAAGHFRKDLIFRLQAHHVHLPPLRERMEDLPYLTRHFITRACRQLDRPEPAVPKGIFTLLAAYDFPGNIRELKGLLVDALSTNPASVLSSAPIKAKIARNPRHVGVALQENAPVDRVIFPARLPTLRQIAELLVDEALERADGNQSVAATLLDISPAAVSKRLKKRRNETKGG